MDKDLKPQFFANAPIPGVAKRTDSNNYVEGQITYGQVIDLTLQENSWLFPGKTCTKAVLSNNGTIVIPTLDNAVGGGVTELCEVGEAGTYGTGQTTVSINKKVSEKFDGCFTVANIADMLLENAINTKKLRVMSETFNNWAYNEVLKVATHSTITKTDGDEIGYVFDRIAEYKVLNHMQPAFALVSTSFLNTIYKSLSKRETNLGDEALINGYAGFYNGVMFIERYDQVEDMMLGSYEDLLIATPSKPEQIPDQRILGAYNAKRDESGFELGMVSLWDINAPAGIVETWVHKYFGLGVLNPKSFTIDVKGAPSNPLNLRTGTNIVVVDNGDEKTIEEINDLYGVYAVGGVQPYTFSNDVETAITDWTKAGNYSITLNVVDKYGDFDDKNVTLTISEASS